MKFNTHAIKGSAIDNFLSVYEILSKSDEKIIEENSLQECMKKQKYDENELCELTSF